MSLYNILLRTYITTFVWTILFRGAVGSFVSTVSFEPTDLYLRFLCVLWPNLAWDKSQGHWSKSNVNVKRVLAL